jgi:uncharacterized protein YndB with AHSA1/START domain
MGRNWIGFQPAVRPVPGRTVHEKASFLAGIPAAEVVALITTRAGLERWLASITAFDAKRGGNIVFLADDGVFTGSFTRIDVPRAVVIMTDRHGEIAINLEATSSATRVNLHVTRLVADSEDEKQVIGMLHAVIANLKEWCAGGR